MKVLFVGRFQPFHNGHMEAIKRIGEKGDNVTIVIAGPGKPDSKNPFTFGERREMISRSLDGNGIDYEIREVEDVNDDEKWIGRIASLNGFDVAYSRNKWTIRCLEKLGIKVKRHEFYERYKNCSTVIRERIREGREWKDLVPREVYAYVKEIGGEKRIRETKE